MDIFAAYQTLDRQVENVLQSINKITLIPDPIKPDYIRLEESPFVLTDEAKRCSEVVTAHDINQYKNEFHSFKLVDDIDCWLYYILKVDERKEIEE